MLEVSGMVTMACGSIETPDRGPEVCS